MRRVPTQRRREADSARSARAESRTLVKRFGGRRSVRGEVSMRKPQAAICRVHVTAPLVAWTARPKREKSATASHRPAAAHTAQVGASPGGRHKTSSM